MPKRCRLFRSSLRTLAESVLWLGTVVLCVPARTTAPSSNGTRARPIQSIERLTEAKATSAVFDGRPIHYNLQVVQMATRIGSGTCDSQGSRSSRMHTKLPSKLWLGVHISEAFCSLEPALLMAGSAHGTRSLARSCPSSRLALR